MSFENEYSACCAEMADLHARMIKLYGRELVERLNKEQSKLQAAFGRKLTRDESSSMFSEIAHALSDECEKMRNSERGSTNGKA